MNTQVFNPIPLKLTSNRVHRSYEGGKLIESWQGLSNPKDNSQPEEWIASAVEARNTNFIQDEGLSKISNLQGGTQKLSDLINRFPEQMLGEVHTATYGSTMGVLTKVLDSSVRLSIQVHPTKQYSRAHFNSEYGKTEAWYIIGGRTIDDEPPYVLVGFKPNITKEQWKQYFEEQDIDAMINSLHKFYVNPGDVYLIEGGLAHAIGSGCFLIEIQEPTDYTMRIERKRFDGSMLDDQLCHQGVGFDNMLDCFTYDGLDASDTLKRCFKKPRIVKQNSDYTLLDLINKDDTACFTMRKLIVNTCYTLNDHSFKTLIILSGEGTINYNEGEEQIKQSDLFFIPAALAKLTLLNTSEVPLEIILCYPPGYQ